MVTTCRRDNQWSYLGPISPVHRPLPLLRSKLVCFPILEDSFTNLGAPPRIRHWGHLYSFVMPTITDPKVIHHVNNVMERIIFTNIPTQDMRCDGDDKVFL